MGIGNLEIRIILHRNKTSHYPSWGLGTGVVGRNEARFNSSLPLMGIGNGPQDTHIRGMSALITPHGDWEPAFLISR